MRSSATPRATSVSSSGRCRLPFGPTSRPRLAWRWKIDQLPSAVPEDQAATLRLSLDRCEVRRWQDLTYIWSEHLPEGQGFPVPVARSGDAIETHMVVRSGKAIGTWQKGRSATSLAHYSAHIGGSAKAISRNGCWQWRRSSAGGALAATPRSRSPPPTTLCTRFSAKCALPRLAEHRSRGLHSDHGSTAFGNRHGVSMAARKRSGE